jgi:Undecaprenyl-phosphate glucose phosphotransferase
VTENSFARPPFLDSRSNFVRFGDSHARRLAPSLPMLFFVYVSVLMDLAVLLALNFTLDKYIFASLGWRYDPFAIPVFFSVSTLFLINGAKLHRIEIIGNFKKYLIQFQRLWLTILLVLIAVTCVSRWYPADARRPSFGYDLLLEGGGGAVGWFAFMGVRYALARSFRYCVEQSLVTHKAIVVGATELAEHFIERVKEDGLGVRVDAIFDDMVDAAALRMLAGVPVRGDIDDLLAYTKSYEIDTVVIALPLSNSERIQQLVRRLSVQPLKVAILPNILPLGIFPDWCAPTGDLPGIQLLAITDLPLKRSSRWLKTVFDRSVAAFLLLLFGPLMLGCVIGIKITSPGPVLFRQKRIGYRNREFEVFKFRSMHTALCNTGELTSRNDPRVFAFGQIMRKLSFDELPQLFNVLKGDMSLVGPRPHMPEARAAGQLYFDVVREYAARHRVKPGITGWAQVNGWRGPTDTVWQIENRVLHDLYYIENWSFQLDLKILIKTVVVGFYGRNVF